MMRYGTPNAAAAAAKPADTFTTDRRWLLGKRFPAATFEKDVKLRAEKGEVITQYMKYKRCSITVLGSNRMLFTRGDGRSLVKDLDEAIVTIVPSPKEGVFMVAMRPSTLRITRPGGEFLTLPDLGDSVAEGPFHWIVTDDFLYLLTSGVFGQVFEIAIRRSDEAVGKSVRFMTPDKCPVSSLTSFTYGGVLHVIVGTHKEIIVLVEGAPGGKFIQKVVISPRSGQEGCAPTHVATNGKAVAWMTLGGLEIFTVEQLLSGRQRGVWVPMSDIAPILGVEPVACISDTKSPVVMSQFYVICYSHSAIAGFSIRDGSMTFKYALPGDPIVMPPVIDDAAKAAFFATKKQVFKIGLMHERDVETVKSIKQEKEECVRALKASKEVPETEILAALLEREDYSAAVHMLSEHLEKHVQDSVSRAGSGSSLTAEEVEQLYQQFLIYELQIIEACKTGNGKDVKTSPLVSKRVRENFDLFGSIVYLLRLRAFSPVVDEIQEQAVREIRESKNSPAMAKVLSQEGDMQGAMERMQNLDMSRAALADMFFKQKDHLKELFKKIQTDSRVGSLMRVFLPFIARDVPAAIWMRLIENETDMCPVDLLVCALSSLENAKDFDAQLSEFFVPRGIVIGHRALESRMDPRRRCLHNPFSTMRYLSAAGLFQTFANVAGCLGLYREAAMAAVKVSQEFANKIIAKAPKSMREGLARESGVKIVDEGESARGTAKEMIVSRLTKLETTIKKLEMFAKEGKARLAFLRELEDWGTPEVAPEPTCARCKRIMRGYTGYQFPCGHCFHEDCLMKEMVFISSDGRSEDVSKLNKDELATDCPFCGMLAAEKFGIPIVADDPMWP